jgi:hypothetical protein
MLARGAAVVLSGLGEPERVGAEDAARQSTQVMRTAPRALLKSRAPAWGAREPVGGLGRPPASDCSSTWKCGARRGENRESEDQLGWVFRLTEALNDGS